MPATILIGTQWGDEGKGKVVDAIADEYDAIVRYQGGDNAGHTVDVNGQKRVLHMIPSGILHKNIINICGNGMVLNLESLYKEIDSLQNAGISVDNLRISHRAHVLMPHHKSLEQITGAGQKVGSTMKGIGPCYTDKVSRGGLRLVDLFDRDRTVEIITEQCNKFNAIVGQNDLKRGVAMMSPDRIIQEAYERFERIKHLVTDTSKILYDLLRAGKNILLEGAQGTMLDIDHGTYPFVTSSTTTAGGACSGAGISPREITDIVGIMKAYTTRVGEGPFPTELRNGIGDGLRKRGKEYGSTTGRPRRCGWLDLAQMKYAIRINGVTELALMKLDILDAEPNIDVCVSYNNGAEGEYDASYELAKASPVYQSFKGWQTPTKDCRSWHHLPEEAKKYVNFIEKSLDTPIKLISVGSDRKQTILR